jgi:predicted nuclease of predicted toxin-antitoxin system
MRVLVDENIPKITVQALTELGNEVLDIRGTERQGADDEGLWALALSETRLLITTDKGFVDHRDEKHYGILIVRLHQPNEERIHARVKAALRQFGAQDWPGLTVVMRDTVQSVWRARSH